MVRAPRTYTCFLTSIVYWNFWQWLENSFSLLHMLRCWCLLFVSIRQGLRGGSGPQRLCHSLTRALGIETGNPIMTFQQRSSFLPSTERATHHTPTALFGRCRPPRQNPGILHLRSSTLLWPNSRLFSSLLRHESTRDESRIRRIRSSRCCQI